VTEDQLSAGQRLRRLEDLEAIRELFQQYAGRFDRRDLVGFSQLFAEGGEWHGRNMHAVGGPPGVLEVFSNRFPDAPTGECHIVGNPIIELDGDRAHATSFGIVLRPGEDQTPGLAMIGYYVDDLVRSDDGRWLFAVRRDYINLPPFMSSPLGPPSTW
jgi:hypothetical protein